MLSAFTAYIMIPIYTLFFVRNTPWFTCNLSVIGSTVERQDAFIFLGVLLGLYFIFILRRLLRLFPKRRLETASLYTALFLLLAAVIIPYLPADLPFWSFLHICFAMTASLLLLFCLSRIIWKLSHTSQEQRGFMRPFQRSLVVIVTACAVLFFINQGIISTAMEVFFIFSTVWLSQRLLSFVRKKYRSV